MHGYFGKTSITASERNVTANCPSGIYDTMARPADIYYNTKLMLPINLIVFT